MERFEDQDLGPTPHIAVFSSTKVGNFVVTTPLLRGLKEKYPGCVLDFFGSEITREFEEASPHIDFRFSLYSERSDFLSALATAVAERTRAHGPYDLAINCDEFAELNMVAVTSVRPRYISGGALAPDFRDKLPQGTRIEHRMLLDSDWDSPGFLDRYGEVLTSNYIAEIFCRMAFVETDFFRLELPSRKPSFDVPDVLLHITTTRSAKMWPPEHWRRVIDWLEKEGWTAGLIGSRPERQRTLYNAGADEDRLIQETAVVDLRGRTPLIELAGALERTRALVTVDAGPLHVAAAVGCPTLALFGNHETGPGASPMRLWAPRQPHVRILHSPHRCTVCSEHRFKNRDCLVAGHPCMRHLDPAGVIQLLGDTLARGDGAQT